MAKSKSKSTKSNTKSFTGIVVQTGGIIRVSRLTAAQARSKDGKGRVALQGFLGAEADKGHRVVHEFSVLRDDRADVEVGEHAFKGVLVLDVAEDGKEHVANGVTYVRHNAKLLRASLTQYVLIPGDKGSVVAL